MRISMRCKFERIPFENRLIAVSKISRVFALRNHVNLPRRPLTLAHLALSVSNAK